MAEPFFCLTTTDDKMIFEICKEFLQAIFEAEVDKVMNYGTTLKVSTNVSSMNSESENRLRELDNGSIINQVMQSVKRVLYKDNLGTAGRQTLDNA